MGCRKVDRHFAQGVAQPDVGFPCGLGRALRPAAAAHKAQAAAPDLLGHFIEALWVARHDQQQRARQGHRAPRFEQRAFFAFARAGGQHDAARRGFAPRTTCGALRGVGCHVVLQVAGNSHRAGAAFTETPRVVFALGEHEVQAAQGRAQQGTEPLALALAAFAQARIGQHEGSVGNAGRVNEVGPDFGFHQHAGCGLEMGEEAAGGAGRVQRQPGLHITITQQRPARIAARCGAMCEQQPHVGQLGAQGMDERCSGARFTQGHGVHPHQAGLRLRLVQAQALARGEAVGRLDAAAPPVAQQRGRRGEPEDQ